MNKLKQIYSTSLPLLTDLYQLTMAYGYWKAGKAQQNSVFHLFFRKNPFGGGYAICAGLEYVIGLIEDLRFSASDLEYLATISGNDAKPIFDAAFLDYLGELKFNIEIDAIPEGTVVFPHEPLLRIKGPILQCQLLETALLNIVNFQTLIATKSARICHATKGEPVLEFGLRRAQGIDGALSASRSAYIGGCAATSNVLAGKLFDIPIKGTHAHSWVMSFDDELSAFEQYAQAMPNNCVFLVDTYDTLSGVENAIKVGQELRRRGHNMVGIRLDSGDLAYLSIEARKMLDQAGFPNATIVASNDLDEYTVSSLKVQNATIAVWGIGTKLATGFDQPALGGVYKLGAVQDEKGTWHNKVKLSEQIIKTSNPGILQVRRYSDANQTAIADVIFSELNPLSDVVTAIDPMDNTHRRSFLPSDSWTDLLVPVVRTGKVVYDSPSIHQIREQAQQQLVSMHESIRRHEQPHKYPVGLDQQLYDLKTNLVLAAREKQDRRAL